jgi:hypothetical protein
MKMESRTRDQIAARRTIYGDVVLDGFHASSGFRMPGTAFQRQTRIVALNTKFLSLAISKPHVVTTGCNDCGCNFANPARF